MDLPVIDYISYGQPVGYGIASVNYLKSLVKVVKQLHWKPVIQANPIREGIEPDFYNDLSEELKGLITVENSDAQASHQIIHTTPEHFPELVCPGLQNIGMTVWETDRLPVNWNAYFKGLDKIIVPCSWNVDIFEQAKLVQSVYRLPHISEFNGEERNDNFLNISDSAFVFLNVSVWERRKNLDQLIKAYFKAFSSKDEIILILKTSGRDVSGPFYSIGKKKKYIKTEKKVKIYRMFYGLRSAKVIVIPHNLNADQMKSLYTRANAYVSLCHSEGWGMGLYESAWYGKPVITTNYSGYLDFLNQKNAYLIDQQMIDVIPNEWESNDLRGHQWAEPVMESAIEQMRSVYHNYEEAKRRGRSLKEQVNANFSAKKITESFLNIIKA